MPNPDGSATLEELANFVIQKEAQPVALGPADVLTPEQAGLMEADIIAQGGVPSQPAEIIPIGQEPVSFDVARQKFLSGTPMNQAEIDFMTRQINQPGGAANVLLSERARQLLGETTAQLAAPGLGAAVGGALGSMVLPGAGTALGAALGSLGGTEFNMRVGLEKDSDIQRVLSFLAPQLGTFTSRVGRGVIKATPAGQALRSEFASDISKRVPDMVFKSPTKAIVDDAFAAVRQSGQTLDLRDFGNALDNLRGIDRDFSKKIIGQIEKAGPEAKAAIGRISPTGTIFTAQATDPSKFIVDAGDVLEIRKAVKTAKDAAFTRKGIGKVPAKRQAQELSKLSTVLDDTINAAAAAGDPAAQAIKEANLLARIQFAQDDVGTLFRTARKTTTQGDRAINEFDINKIDTQLDQAREAVAAGEDHRFGNLVKTLDELGDRGEFEAALRQLRQLSPKNNPQLFGESFGLITRAAQFAARTTGANLIGEVMLNKASRNTFLKLIRATNGRFSIPILATAAAVGRAASGQPLDEVSEMIVSKLVNEKAIVTEEELQAATIRPLTESQRAGLLFNPPGQTNVQPSEVEPTPPPPLSLIQRFSRGLEPARPPRGLPPQ